jgi:hypothetical protein
MRFHGQAEDGNKGELSHRDSSVAVLPASWVSLFNLAAVDAAQGLPHMRGDDVGATGLAARQAAGAAVLTARSWRTGAAVKKRARVTHNPHPSFVPERAGQSWTDKEDAQLREEHGRGLTVKQMAEAHLRTVVGIEARLIRLGVIKDPAKGAAGGQQ